MSIKFDNYWRQIEREQGKKKKVVRKPTEKKFTRKERIQYFRAKREMEQMDEMFENAIK